VKVRVTLNLNGRVFTETVEARDYQDAKEIARRRNSKQATIVSVTGIF
jgi:hypothetical protein